MPFSGCRTILPITDPYVVHHGALGSFATVYLDDKADSSAAVALLERHECVERVMTKEVAAAEYELPPDRIGEYHVPGREIGLPECTQILRNVRQAGRYPW